MVGEPRRIEPRLVLLGLLERGARILRKLGLGRMVDVVAQRLAPAVGAFELEVDGLRLGGNHIGQLYYVRELVDEGRESYFVELLTSAVRPRTTVLEGGAHIGYVTLQAARAVGASGQVMCFEPNPRTLQVLRRNIATNGFADRVRIVPAALGDASGHATLHLTEGGDASSLHVDSAVADVVVEVTTADEAVPSSTVVDVVKLDVEGAEVAALRGMRSLLDRAAPGPTLLVECNPGLLRAAGTSDVELIASLEELGFAVHWIDEAGRRLRPLGDLAWTGEYVNLYATRRSAEA